MLSAIAIGFTSCNDNFMELYPDTSLTEKTVFSNYNTFKTYSWGLYSVFENGNILRRPGTGGSYASALSYQSDIYAGYLMHRQDGGNPYAFQNIFSVASGNGWDFSYVYRVNVMLTNIDKSEMTDAEKAHWRSVGYFFRAYYYMELIARFGDVPWIDHVLGDSDTEVTYGPRTPRKEVADHVLSDLKYAEENIGEAGDGANTIDVHVVRALLSRFCLFEGTWRKYHGLGDENKYLDECINYSKKLMDTYPDLNSDWGEMLTSDLQGMPGIILYKEYIAKEMTNYVLTHVERTSTHNVEMPQHIIDMYLCSDGKTISNSPLYQWKQDGDKSMHATFSNRDRRLLETVAPPYRVVPKNSNDSFDFTNDPKDREFMDIMGITHYTGYGGGNGEAGKHKVFPLMNWGGKVLKTIPHFFTNNGGQGFIVARSGNYVYRYYNVWDNSKENEGTSDVPLFKIDEVMLNYAEAKFEKAGTGTDGFTQEVADATINKLRKRAYVADMKVNEINAAFDPQRDPSVDPVLWEIRRERIIELMCEGFGFYDVRRWKKAPWFINHIQYGQWATKEQIGAKGQIVDLKNGYADATGKTEGFIYMYNSPEKSGKGWLDKYYLYQIPTNQIALNPELKPNNPGWE